MSKPVYANYDQAGLDRQYDVRRLCPHLIESMAAMNVHSQRTISDLRCQLDIAFGSSPGEKLDIWHGKGDAPILMFIHGGYWRSFDKNQFSYVAERFAEAGACVAINNYDLAPKVSVDNIVQQNRAALTWLYQNAASFGGDPNRIHITGHSAGGHLAAMLMATSWDNLGLPHDLIKGAVLLSGLFDLEPIRHSFLNADVRLDEDSARRNSPIHAIPEVLPPTLVAVGGGESDEFLRQSKAYVAAAHSRNSSVSYLELGHLDHMQVLSAYRDRSSPLASAILGQMGL